MPSTRLNTALVALALIAVAALAYWPGLTGGFMFDDFSNIVREDPVHMESLDLESIRRAAGAYLGPIGRPLATVSFALDYWVSGLDPWRFKLTGLLIHLVNTLLVFQLVRRLLPLSNAPARWGNPAAFSIALLWAIHPLQVSTVLYVVQRMETLSLLMVLLALLAYLRGRLAQMEGRRGWPWLLACLPLMGLGLMSKETAVLLPAYLLALELTVLGFRAEATATSRLLKWGYLLATLAAVAAFALFVLPHYATDNAYAIRDFSVEQRLMTQLRAVSMYLGWILLPRPASYVFYYDSYPFSTGWLDPGTTLASGIFLLSIFAAGVLLRRKLPMFSLGIFWFFAAHLLTSNVIPLELVYEHRNYFALLGVLLAAAEVVRRMPESEVPRIRTVAVAIVLVGVLGLTLIRSATWGNSFNLATELVAKNPNSSRASMDLGEHYMLLARNDPESRFFAMGIKELERGSRVPDASLMPEQGLIVYSAVAGQPAQPEWWDRVVHKLENRAIGPQEIGMIIDLLRMRQEGVAFDDGRFADAYLVLVNRIEMPATQYYAFGEHALKYLKDNRLAFELFKRTVDHSRDDPGFVRAIVETLAQDGHPLMAHMVSLHARDSGMADIPLPPLPIEPGEQVDSTP